MSEPMVFIDSSEIREEKLEEFKMAMKELVEFVETNEPRPIAYNVYIREDDTRKPSDDLLELMRQKAQMLGNVTVHVHELHAGFNRFGIS